MPGLNVGRLLAFQTFRETLHELKGTRNVTEIMFRETWRHKLRSNGNLSLNGWYDPPPAGMAILFGTDHAPQRLAFTSLRSSDSWPGTTTMDWSRGLLLAYCSMVDLQTGLPGDFMITLYFGKNPDLLAHFRNSFAATRKLLSLISTESTSSEVFRESERIFYSSGLRNIVVSSTDAVELDLGHSLPEVSPSFFDSNRDLSPELCATISRGRRFINAVTNWKLSEASQVTVEPQLVSLSNPILPKISFHYVVSFLGGLHVLNECDDLFSEFGMIE